MRISDWSSDVCSSDLHRAQAERADHQLQPPAQVELRAVAVTPGFGIGNSGFEKQKPTRQPAFALARIPTRIPAAHGLITTMSAVSGNFIPSREIGRAHV